MCTKNKSYNETLKEWARKGHHAEPECEECGCDLTGKDVVDVGIGWFCSSCAEDFHKSYDGAIDEAKAERQQMGITGG